jgi:hypothetical protein
LDGIVDNLLRLSQLVTDFPEIKELDMNPLKVLDTGGIMVMDAKAVLNDEKIVMPVSQREILESEVINT